MEEVYSIIPTLRASIHRIQPDDVSRNGPTLDISALRDSSAIRAAEAQNSGFVEITLPVIITTLVVKIHSSSLIVVI